MSEQDRVVPEAATSRPWQFAGYISGEFATERQQRAAINALTRLEQRLPGLFLLIESESGPDA